MRTVARKGFETAILIPAGGGFVAVRALARNGAVLSTSAALKR